ncbi:vesicle transport protein SFT2C-like [Scomber scombrus]|uniref:vesicle transport protein SFT2C-like n=1 Tax=Scomber scombrus TaxID=13677 RepID=UPI002DD7DCB3|nr:vesicle transport protein SFT2C-like [Scomber scombrus]XP_062285651.1 vesicle transport protein SFT2C-like [Scomber scombrus]
MAELNRQLQEYLLQSKGGKTGSQSGSSTAVDMDGVEPVSGSWFGRWSSPWSGGSAGQSSGSSGGVSWPWWSEPDPCLPGMSRRQRLVASAVCGVFSSLCFALSALYAPLLLLYARKFALLWSLGSLFALAAVAVLRGPSRLAAALPTSPGAAVYLCALIGTLYAALSLHSTVLTALGAALQVAVILGCLVSLLPGGSAGLRFMGGMAASALKRTVTGKTMAI